MKRFWIAPIFKAFQTCRRGRWHSGTGCDNAVLQGVLSGQHHLAAISRGAEMHHSEWKMEHNQQANCPCRQCCVLYPLLTNIITLCSGGKTQNCVPPHVGASLANQEWGGAPAAGRRALYRGGGDGGGGEKLSEDHPEFASCGMYKPQPLPLSKSRVRCLAEALSW